MRLRSLIPTVQTIYGRDGRYRTPYLTRVAWGPFFLHWFYRGDADPDPHDHRRAFWTFPLTSYVEATYRPHEFAPLKAEVVRAFRLHRREAFHAHRLIGRWSGLTMHGDHDHAPGWLTKPGPIVTVGRWDRSREPREWGFWVLSDLGSGHRRFVPWRSYVYGADA